MKKIFLVLFLLFFGQNFAFANNEHAEVRKFVDDIGNKIIKIAADKKISEKTRRDKIIHEVDVIIDSEWIARFVLGKNYRKFSDGQKEKFKELYRQFMINTYGPKFKNYNGRKFTVLKVEKQKIFYVARCEFLPLDSNVPISVDFRVKDKNGQLVVIDFVAEGVSLLEAQRSEFDSAISQKGIENFMADLSKRVVELKKSSL